MDNTQRVDATELVSVCSAILSNEGVPVADAKFVASTLVEADLKGIHSHGILRLKRYVRELRTRVTNPLPHIGVSDEGPAIARVDGDGA
ncbi:MAG: Ldh family oxidoreductase, partial [Candidatus Latescibacterota bacterium]|nr:Ldh family oxidoreductase [Candidatus Latescibacterota bacterium]